MRNASIWLAAALSIAARGANAQPAFPGQYAATPSEWKYPVWPAELARAHGIRVVLASLLPVSDDKKDSHGRPFRWIREHPKDTLLALNRWIAEYAAANGHVYLDYFSATVDERGCLDPELTDDGLHPNAAGYAVMSPLAEQAIAAALR